MNGGKHQTWILMDRFPFHKFIVTVNMKIHILTFKSKSDSYICMLLRNQMNNQPGVPVSFTLKYNCSPHLTYKYQLMRDSDNSNRRRHRRKKVREENDHMMRNFKLYELLFICYINTNMCVISRMDICILLVLYF